MANLIPADENAVSERSPPSKPGFRWKEAVAGGLITLVVKFAGSLLFWLITRTPERVERLTFVTSVPSVFYGNGRVVSFSTITVTNEGGAKSSNVIISDKLAVGNHIVRKVTDLNSGRPSEIRDLSDKEALRLSIVTLLPGESATSSVLTDGSSPNPITFSVSSDQQIAKQKAIEAPPSKGMRILTIVAAAVCAVAFQLLLTQLLSYRRYKREEGKYKDSLAAHNYYYPGLNNTGFLMLHAGNIPEAISFFEKDIAAGTAELMTFSHLASAYALLGDSAKAADYLKLASWPTDPHSAGNVALDTFIIRAHENNVPAALEALKSGIRKTIGVVDYFKYSQVLSDFGYRAPYEQTTREELGKKER